MCQKESGVGIPTPHAVLPSPVEESTGTEVFGTEELSTVSVELSEPCTFPQGQQFWNVSRFFAQVLCMRGLVDISDDQSRPKSSKMLACVSSKSSKMLAGGQLEKCGLARAVQPIRAELSSNLSGCESAHALESIHSRRSSHATDGRELGHTLQSGTIRSSRIGFLSTCLCSCAGIFSQRHNFKKVKEYFPSSQTGHKHRISGQGSCSVRLRSAAKRTSESRALGGNHQSCSSCLSWELTEGHSTHARLPRNGSHTIEQSGVHGRVVKLSPSCLLCSRLATNQRKSRVQRSSQCKVFLQYTTRVNQESESFLSIHSRFGVCGIPWLRCTDFQRKTGSLTLQCRTRTVLRSSCCWGSHG